MIKINLVPKEILDQDVQRQRLVQAGLAVGAVILVIAGFSMWRWQAARGLEAVQAQKQKDFDALQAILAEADALEAQAKAVKQKLDVINGLLQGRALYPVFMQDLSRTLPPQVWVLSVGTTAGKSRGELDISLSAKSYSSEAIAAWIRNFNKSGRFSDPTLSAVSIAPATGDATGKIHSFSIKTLYKNPEI